MPDTYIRFDGVDGESENSDPDAAAPAVRIPITIKHHDTPPEEPDDLAAGTQDPAPEGGSRDAFFVKNDSETTTQSAAAAADPYGHFNFTVDIDGDAADGEDDDGHDIIFDPDGDLLPPGKPTGAAEFEEQVTFDFTGIEFREDTDAPGDLTGGGSTEETQTADGPHQGRHDIGGYVPSTIIAGDTDLQAPGTGGDTGSAEEAPARGGEGDTLVHEIGHWLGVAPATGEDTREDSPAPTGIMQSVEPVLEEAPDPQSASVHTRPTHLPTVVVVDDSDDAPEFDPGGSLASGSDSAAAFVGFDSFIYTVVDDGVPADGHELTHIAQSGGGGGQEFGTLPDIPILTMPEEDEEDADSFDFTDLPGDAEAPVPPGEIIIMPDSSCPPDMTDDGGCGDPVPDMPVDEGVLDWGMELA